MRRYLCIGGPLDGVRASSEDFESAHTVLVRKPWPPGNTIPTEFVPAGRYAQHADEYVSFNNAGGAKRAHSMIRVHRDLLR